MRTAVRIGAATVGGALAVLALAACQPAKSVGGGAAPAPSASAPASAPPSGKPGSGNGGGGGAGNGNGGGPGAGQPSNSPGSAHIVYFKISQQPKCPQGTNKFPVPGVPVEITWKVTGATGVALSVDDPHHVGSYGKFGPEGKMTFQFSCNGKPGTTESHTYRITTTGGTGSPQTSQVLTATATVYEIANV
jgi:hypothetical protein